MASPLEWLFKFFDNAAGPAEKVAKSVDHVAAASDKATKATKAHDDAQQKVTKSLLQSQIATAKAANEIPRLQRELASVTDEAKRFHVEWGNAFHSFAGFRFDQASGWTFNVADGLKAITSAAGFAARAVVDVLDTLGRGQEAREALEDRVGAGESQRLGKWFDRIAGKTAFRDQQLREFAASASEYFEGFDLERVLVASLDVGRSSEGRVRAALDKFKAIAATGKIEGESLKVFGIDEAGLMARLMERTGLKSAEAVKKALAAGKVGKEDVLESVFGLIAGKEGGELGGRAFKAGETIAGRMNRLRGIQESFIDRVIGKPENIEKIEKFLGRLAEHAEKIIDLADRLTGKGQPAVPGAVEKATKASPFIAGKNPLFTDAETERFKAIRRTAGEWAAIKDRIGLGPFKDTPTDVVIAGAPAAHDFVWRAGQGIATIDPADTLIGAKGALGDLLGGRSSPAPQAPAGGLRGVVTLGEGAVQVSVTAGPGTDAKALVEQIEELLPGALITVVEKVNAQMGNG